jgi:hypothetical protein
MECSDLDWPSVVGFAIALVCFFSVVVTVWRMNK